MDKEEAKAKAIQYLEKVGIDERARAKYPAHLSGGQQQRVPHLEQNKQNPFRKHFQNWQSRSVRHKLSACH